MIVRENAAVFFGNPVRDYQDADDWDGVDTAYRLRVHGRSAQERVTDYLDALVQHPNAPRLEALVIGAWDADANRSSQDVVRALASHRERLRGLQALFLGDISHNQTEMSAIHHADLSPLLQAYPRLEVLRVRGANGLQFSALRHESLRELIVESSGLPRSVLRDIGSCDFPSLLRLDLCLGSAAHGWDGEIRDLQPILDGALFPCLRHLGLRHSEFADQIAAVIVGAPIVEQLRVLDLSSNHLSDVGARFLMSLPWIAPLRRLVLTRHAMSNGMPGKLGRELICKVVAADLQEADDTASHHGLMMGCPTPHGE